MIYQVQNRKEQRNSIVLKFLKINVKKVSKRSLHFALFRLHRFQYRAFSHMLLDRNREALCFFAFISLSQHVSSSNNDKRSHQAYLAGRYILLNNEFRPKTDEVMAYEPRVFETSNITYYF